MDAMTANKGVLLALLVLAAWHDIRHFRIPNLLTFGGALLGLAAALLLPDGRGLGWSLAGWGVGLLILLPLYALGAMGAGDVKLLAMAGAFAGPVGAVLIGLYTVLAGGLLALAVAVGGGRLRQALRNLRALVLEGAVPSVPVDSELRLKPAAGGPALEEGLAGRLPYGVAILLGGLAWWWQTT